MDLYSDIVQFAQDLYLHNTDIIIPREDRERLKPTAFISSASQTLDLFRDAFYVQFHKLYKKHISEVSDTEEQFLIYTIPRCLKLVDEEYYYFSFMLVAAFIQELVYYFDLQRICYRFSGTAYKCLAAVFKRRFEDTFKENGAWRGLESFCNIYENMNAQKKHRRRSNFLDGDYEQTRRVLQLIQECDVAQDECFSLNEYELKLIETDDQLAIKAYINDYITESEDSPDQVEREKQEEKGTDDKSSDTITDEAYLKPTSLLNSLNIETPPDSDSSSESSDIEYLNFVTVSGCETLNYSSGRITSQLDVNIKRSSRVSCCEHDPKVYGKVLSERMCNWCNKMCYEYAKYFFRQHRDFSLKP